MPRLSIILLVINLIIDFGSADLNSVWNVSLYRDNQFVKYFETKIPSGIYTGAVPNIFWNDNDVKYRYIGNCTTYYLNEFISNSSLLAASRVVLIFHGIDTFADIELNGHKIGKTSNMFTRYAFDIKDYLLKDGMRKNRLNVTIESAVKVAEEIYNNQSKNYIIYPKCVPNKYNGECHVNHIRKMQASFSWDWGPAVPSSGIWRDAQIVAISDVYMMDHTLDVYPLKNENWRVNLTTLLEIAPNTHDNPIMATLQLTLEHTNFTNIVNSKSILVKNGDEQKIVSVTLDVPKLAVRHWWPNGYGKQNLYNIHIKLNTRYTNIKVTRRIGFRTVELVQEPLTEGLTFYFRINGIPIFAKGSNLIPISIVPEKSTNYIYLKNLLSSVKEAHMNMLRVWGGGVYESEMFYNMADELGIMIWQDFMFACAMYPTTQNFLNSVREEVVQNVWRLKSHPSVVLWAGNNENEAALYGNWYGTGKNQIYRDDYIELYVNLIKREVEKWDSTRPFVVSSPSNGLWADENGWIGTDPYSHFYGDIHYYNYINNGWNINNYSPPRFSSEYGVQSLPSIYTFIPVTKNTSQDLLKNSQFIEHRQHLPDGNSFMEILISQNFKIPSTNDSLQDFDNYIYLSQINQAQSVKVQTELYRQARNSLNDIGEGYTMGALYWQLNDVWQAPSWSSIDVDGRWKILHYYAKEFFAPIIISPHLSVVNDISIFIISDELTSRINCTVEVNVHKIYKDNHPNFISYIYKNVSVQSNSAYKLATIELKDILISTTCGNTFSEAKKNCIVELILKDSNNKTIAPVNYIYPTAPKNFNLPLNCPVFVRVAYADENNNRYSITIQSACTLLFVWLDLPGYMVGKFSENGFHILQGSKTIYFENSSYAIHIQPFTRKLRIITLGNIHTSPMLSPIVVCPDCMF